MHGGRMRMLLGGGKGGGEDGEREAEGQLY